MGLHFRTLAQAALSVSRETDGVLGGTLLGLPASAVDWPEQQIFAPLPAIAAGSLREIWQVDAAWQEGCDAGIRWRRSGELLYGVLSLDESGFAGDCRPPLQLASETAYRRIFALLDAQGLPELWRVWNYFADINGETHGLERYRQFNIGRQDAFLACRRESTANAPAACAIGVAAGPLSIAFLAGRQAVVPVENPRQLRACDYPPDYGPRSPLFSRAVLARPPGQELLMISGTASIVGHRSVHPGDVPGQCRETLANIASVVSAANALCRGPAFRADELVYRVYLRAAADLAAVRAEMHAALGPQVEVVYVQADICRSDLLLEIEALAAHALEDA